MNNIFDLDSQHSSVLFFSHAKFAEIASETKKSIFTSNIFQLNLNNQAAIFRWCSESELIVRY